MKIRVYYEDTDMEGVVYYANYLKFCERARSEWFFSQGMMPTTQVGHFMVKRVEADYLSSARLGDLLDVRSKIIEMKKASMTVEQTIYKEETKLFVANITLVHVGFDGKIKKVDEKTKEFFYSLAL